MIKKMICFTIAAGFMLVVTSSVNAAVSHYEIANPEQDIPAVSDYMTTGADMAGMKVTVFFSDGNSESAIWAATGVDSGQAKGTNWTLSEAGDTFNSSWTLLYEYNAGILLTGFKIDGFAAGPGKQGVMFDRTFPDVTGAPQFGTPNSFFGRDLELAAPVTFDVAVTYIGAVGVAGNAPVGDEFRWLNASFFDYGGIDDEFNPIDPVPTGLDGEIVRSFIFRQDTNNPIIPEPATFGLFGLGGLMMIARRR